MIHALIASTPLYLFIIEIVRFFGGVGILSFQILRDTINGKVYWKLMLEQIFQVGNRSLPLIVVTAISTGMVMSLQFGLGLEKFGGKMYVPKLVSLIVLREMGPVFTSLMVAARVGAGFASEIGSMVVTQQIDAIRALGTSPIKTIVVPRVMATFISLPLLVAIANVVSNFGALLVGYSELKLDPNFYVLKIIQTVTLMDYLSGFTKSFVFALCIAIPSCYFGLTVKNGTKEVGMATTKAVVVSSILVLVSNFFLSKLFWILERLT